MTEEASSTATSPSRERHASGESFTSAGSNPQSDTHCPTDDFLFIETSHPIQLLSGLNELRNNQQFCDVTICCGDQEFRSHKIVLASFSAYFKAMFSVDLAESKQEKVTINGVEPNMIQLLIDYAYTSEVLLTKSNVQSLLSAANLLEVLTVRDACCQFMEKNMDETNCLGIHCFAEAHACTELQEKAKQFTMMHFPDVCQQEEFVNLTLNKLIEFVESDDLCVDNEEIVFNAVIRWAEHDKVQHSADIHRVLEHVRLPLLTPYFLHDCVAKHPIVEESVESRTLLDEAKTYHLLQDRRHELQSPRSRPRKASGMVEVIIAVGGEDDKVVLRSVQCYDLLNKIWRNLQCLPFAVSKHGVVVSGNNYLYMAGGEFPDGSASRSMWRYDPCFDNWQEMASMNTPRSELGLAMLDGHVYAVGGWEGSSRLDTVERYSQVANGWTFVAPMKMALTSPAVVSHDGQLYVTGGAVLEDGDGIDLVQCFNPLTNQWTDLTPMLIARSGSSACVLNGYIYVIGGWHASTENTNKVERYDPRTDTWETRTPMSERRYRPGVAVVDGRIYVCGGEEGWDRYHDTVECYDEGQDSWQIFGEMESSRSWLSCVSMTLTKEIVTRGDKASTFIV